MRRVLLATSLLLTAWVSSAQATNVAVADSQTAVYASNVAKKMVEDLNAKLKPERERVEKLTAELKAIEERFQKDAKILTDKDKLALQAQARSKYNEVQSTSEGMQRRVQEMQTALLKDLMPKMEKIVEDLRKESKYDIIIEKKNVMWSDESVDITKKITERLNAAQ